MNLRPFSGSRGANRIMTVGAVSASIPIDPSARSIRLVNSGSSICYVRIGQGEQTATSADVAVFGNSEVVLSKGEGEGTLAFISASGTTLQAQTGSGGTVPGYQVVDQLFLTGDGVTQSGQLVDQFGRTVKPVGDVALTRTDWQGVQALSPNPRTNLFNYSEDITNWSTAPGTSSTATSVSDTSNSIAGYRKSQSASVPQDSLNYSLSFLVAKGDTISRFSCYLDGGTQIINSMCLNTTTGDTAPLSNVGDELFWLVEDFGSSGWFVTVQLQNNNTAAKSGILTVYPTRCSYQDPPVSAYYWPSEAAAMGTVGVTKVQLEVTPDQSNIKWLLFGDSLSSGGPVLPCTWWHLIGLAPSCFSGYAADGATAAQVQTAYDAHKAEACTDVCIECGVNSLRNGISAATIFANLQYMWADAKARGHRVWTVTVPPWNGHTDWSAEKQTETEALNALIRSASSEYDYLIDIYALFEDPENLGAYLPRYQSSDLLHPAPLAMNVWAQDVRSRFDFPRPYTPYIGPTTTAPVTVTDYTLGAGGLITLGEVPVVGAQLKWSGIAIHT